MGQTSDELRQELDARRDSASEKINSLQQQVQGTAEDLKTQAQDTVDQVKETVQSTIEDTVTTLKENVDLEAMIRERPLVALGAGLIGGMVVGGLMRNGGGSSSRSASGTSSSHGGDSGLGSSLTGMTDSLKDLFKSSGLEDAINNAASAAMGSVTQQIKDVVERNMPNAGSGNRSHTPPARQTSPDAY